MNMDTDGLLSGRFWLARADDSIDFATGWNGPYCEMLNVFAYAEADRPTWMDIFARIVGPGDVFHDEIGQMSPERAGELYGIEIEEGEAVLLDVRSEMVYRPDGSARQVVVAVEELERFKPARLPGNFH